MLDILVILLILCLVVYCHVKDLKEKEASWLKWDKEKKNFPLRHNGRTIWYSRSVATTLFTFGKKNNEWYVLATKRGKGTPDFQGYWNCQSGYLEFDVDGKDNCLKELKEECGITIPRDLIVFDSVNTKPTENKQNVGIRYVANVGEITEELSNFSKDFMEKDEVDECKWIHIGGLDNYEWAFNHKELIKEMFSKHINV